MNLRQLSLLGLVCGSAIGAHAATHVGIGIAIGMPAPVIVREAPPRHAQEVMVASPGPGYTWVAGHYSWSNNQWVWVQGAWITPPQPTAFWVEGRWDGATQSWTEGHWEVSQPVQPTGPPPPVVVVPAAPAPVGQIIITTAPPPLRHEVRSHRPGRGYVWIPGYWAYRGNHQVWIAGRWDLPPRGRRVWVEPRWERRGGGYVFIEGQWR